VGLVRLGQESCPGGSLEDFANTLAGTSRAFKIFVGTNLLSDLLTLVRGDRSLRGLVQLIDGLLVVTEIDLASNQNDREALAEMKNLRDPLLLNVVQRIGRVNSKADQDDV
jgi:hypothetical protein